MDETGVRPFLLTNRYNLLEYLASQLVEPVESFTKYYRDLLEYAPGRLPLISSPFDPAVVAQVSSEDVTSFPVALEIDAKALGSGTPTATLSGSERAMQAWAPAGTIPLASVIAIHFRTPAELEEHQLRAYENVRHVQDRYRVSPQLFEASGGASEGLTEWLEAMEAVVARQGSATLRRDGHQPAGAAAR